ncbi:MAG: hypothetical protein ACE148_17455 [Vicinamibacterales bacterium]
MLRRCWRTGSLAAVALSLSIALHGQDREGEKGVLQGRVEMAARPAAIQPRPGVSDLGANPAWRPRDDRRAVVYLENAPVSAFEPRPTDLRATIDQENETFVPHVVAVPVGATVDFPNSDPFFHNVFSLSKARRFDLGRYAQGRSKAVRFDQPGIVRVFCDIHSHMSAFILVFAHPFFAVTEPGGQYRIEGVPPGSYSVAAWYEGEVVAKRRAAVPPAGGVVRVDFSVR